MEKEIKFELDTSGILNPFNIFESCTLKTSKKKDLYIHEYKCDKTKEYLESNLGNCDLSIFDFENKTNCCNVISIMLYLKEYLFESNSLPGIKNVLKTIEKYIFSIYRSVKNIEKNLATWIIRIYLDNTVYEGILKLDEFSEIDFEKNTKDKIKNRINKIKEKFEYIINNKNVEIYTFQCNSFQKLYSYEDEDEDDDDEKDIIEQEFLRTLRFLPLIDPEVNIAIIREADGIVSNLDCHNCKCFANDKDYSKIFYLPKVIDDYSGLVKINKGEYITQTGSIIEDVTTFSSYSDWLYLYKILFRNDFFRKNFVIYELLAGTFSCKLKLNKETFLSKLNELKREISEINGDNLKIMDEKLKELLVGHTFKEPPYKIHHEITDTHLSFIKRKLIIGFDEILLLDIYKEIISVQVSDYNKIEESKIYSDIRMNLFYGYHNMFKYNLENFNKIKIIEKLNNLNIISIEYIDINSNLDRIPNNLFIDFILDNIKTDHIFDIISNESGNNVLELINDSFEIKYDDYYDNPKLLFKDNFMNYKNKYIKYKSKYISLKNKFKL